MIDPKTCTMYVFLDLDCVFVRPCKKKKIGEGTFHWYFSKIRHVYKENMKKFSFGEGGGGLGIQNSRHFFFKNLQNRGEGGF